MFSLDDLSNGKALPRRKSGPVEGASVEGASVEGASVEGASVEGASVEGESEEDASGDGVAMRRKREETQVRSHAFLRQTVPPKDPVVREVERRRSGGDEDD